MNTIVMTGGGTAGHVMPALALLPYWRPYFDAVCYTGQTGGMEERLAAQAGVPFFGTDTIKFERKKWWRNAAIPKVLHKAVNQIIPYLAQNDVRVVFSKGGYCALPTVLAAHKLGIPIVCHESDRTIGLANRVSIHFTPHLITSFVDTPRGVYMGNPVRDDIGRGEAARVAVFHDRAKPVVLVMGGSLGALSLNRVVAEMAPRMEGWNIVNLYGRSPCACESSNYYGLPYADNIADWYALADVVVCRAGANTLFELAALGKPTVMVPLPKGASRGDQEDNARYFHEQYGFVLLPQGELTSARLQHEIRRALREGIRPMQQPKDVNRRIAEYVWHVSQEDTKKHKKIAKSWL